MIKGAIQLGEPVEYRGVTVTPLYPRTDATADYVTLEEALPLGFRITEIAMRPARYQSCSPSTRSTRQCSSTTEKS